MTFPIVQRGLVDGLIHWSHLHLSLDEPEEVLIIHVDFLTLVVQVVITVEIDVITIFMTVECLSHS